MVEAYTKEGKHNLLKVADNVLIQDTGRGTDKVKAKNGIIRR
jgi:hypothetical protein